MGDELDNWEQPPVVPSGEEKVEYHFELDSGDSGWVAGSLSMAHCPPKPLEEPRLRLVGGVIPVR